MNGLGELAGNRTLPRYKDIVTTFKDDWTKTVRVRTLQGRRTDRPPRVII